MSSEGGVLLSWDCEVCYLLYVVLFVCYVFVGSGVGYLYDLGVVGL